MDILLIPAALFGLALLTILIVLAARLLARCLLSDDERD